MKTRDHDRRQLRRVGHQSNRAVDPEVAEGSDRRAGAALESQSSAEGSRVGMLLGEIRRHLVDARSVLIPVLKRAGARMLAQFSELSRISARPAAIARMASANRIRTQPMIVRVLLVPAASFFIAFGVAAQVTSGLGVGPGDMVASGISTRTGLSFGSAALVMSGVLALLSTILGRAPRMATLVNVALIALSIDVLLPLLAIEGGFLARLVHFLFGLWSIGVGIGCLLHARLGIGTHEALSLSISDRTGIPVKKVRLGQEITWIVIGLALGSQFGLGTFLVALFIGPAISAGARLVGGILRSLSRAVEAPEVAAHVGDIGF